MSEESQKYKDDQVLLRKEETSDSSFKSCCPQASLKLSTSICIGTWGFFTGIERAIIIPTLYLYLDHSFDQKYASTYYAPTLAAFSLSIFLFSPVYGLLAYKGLRTKPLLVISNLFEILGNILYLVAHHPWLVVIGRLISGFGAGVGTPLTADIVRVTTNEERTFYICIMYVAIQLGLIIGPTVTIALSKLHVQIGQFLINVYNAPGLVMAITWTVHTFLCFLTYPLLTKNGLRLSKKSLSTLSFCERLKVSCYEKTVSSEPVDTSTAETSYFQRFKQNYGLYASYAVLCLLLISFSGYFSLMALETVLPPLAVKFLKWSEVQLSYLYFACGITIVIVYGVIFLLPKVSNRTMIACGLLTACVAYLWLTFVTAFINDKQPVLYITLSVFGIFFHIVGITMLAAAGQSLYSKVIPVADVDRAQTVSNTMANFALLVGPYVGGALYSYPYVVFLIMFILILVSSVQFLRRYDVFDY